MSDNNVTPINGKGKKPKKQEKDKGTKPPKLTHGIVEEFLVRYMTDGELQVFMPDSLPHEPLPVWFHKPDDSSGTRMVAVDEKKGIARQIDFETLVRMIHQVLSRFAIEDHPCKAYCLSQSGAVNLAKRLQACGRRLEKWPEPCGFKHQEGLFFQRLDFDPEHAARPEDFPFIQGMLNRMTNSGAFCQRIGSLFEPTADRKQAVILYGPGDGGKTTILNLVQTLVGDGGYAYLSEGLEKDNHGLMPLVDKRLWIGEEIPARFYRSSAFKRITGGGGILINPKGEKHFMAHLRGMLFANSNEAPAISNDSGLLNRLIICHVASIPEDERLPENEVRELMDRELPFFVGYCMDQYKGGRIVPESAEELTSAVADYESPFELVFSEYFVEDPIAIDPADCSVIAADITEAWGNAVEEMPGVTRGLTLGQFRTFISRKTGRDGQSFSVQSKRGGKKIRVIPGIRKA